MNARVKEGPFKVDPETSAEIQKFIQRQYEPDRSFLEGKVLDHEPLNISEAERDYRIRLANIALLRNSDWKGTPGEVINVLEELGHEGYVHTDYTMMNSHKILAYFDEVTKEIGTETLFYCPDIAFDIMAKNREARSRRT